MFVVIVGGYAATAALVAGVARVLPVAGLARSEAVALASMCGFVFYLALLIWGFSRRRLMRLVLGLALAGGFGLALMLDRDVEMEQGFRSSMNVLHTWAGVVLGALLFAIFWRGALSVYDREIDRWMAPMTRVALPDKPTSFDALRGTYDAAVAAGARSGTMLQPSERQPVVRIVYRDGEEPLSLYFDPVTGAALPKTGTWAGTRFFYPFHYRLHLRAWDIGEWLVGIAAMTMLLLCVSGLVIHRKMIAEFFMLRTRQKSARVVLDLHTVAGVLGLPFNFIIALSGLIILFIAFFPSGWQASYPDRKSFNEEAYSAYSRPKAKKPGTLMSLDLLAGQARQMWGGAEPWAIVVQHPGDAAAFVSVHQSFDLGIVRSAPVIHFDAAPARCCTRAAR